ncbi:PUA-like domain-containing protein [Bombardia bombarda]|uniref:PUA-like domain-containing protein n=1 Tax=Bombardia bombarda TaxID=252184 RepID=A0AA39X0L4_9PEZI|nr:PUA-like domain-containing protein [Bombardia bombarda]
MLSQKFPRHETKRGTKVSKPNSAAGIVKIKRRKYASPSPALTVAIKKELSDTYLNTPLKISPISRTVPPLLVSHPVPLPAATMATSPLDHTSPPPSPPGQPSQHDETTTTVSIWVGSMEDGVKQIRFLLNSLWRRYTNGPSLVTDDEVNRRIRDVRAFLWHLEFEVEMSPALKNHTKLDQNLALVQHDKFKDAKDYIPADIFANLARLLQKFESERWGADEDNNREIEEVSSTTRSSTSSNLPITRSIRLPPVDHPIWGINGIMHGLALTSSTRTVVYLDPRYISEKRSAKVHGHNGLKPGDWWPFQRAAHFHGAHGAPVRGITGSPEYGAYSIVTSGSSTYEKLDEDKGETLYYSADNSHDNTSTVSILTTSNATKSLHKSYQNRQPVRVLRNSGSGNHYRAYAPSCGIRYDGLYRVVNVRRKHNRRGGLYEQFELQRLDNQVDFQQVLQYPKAEQIADYEKIKDSY